MPSLRDLGTREPVLLWGFWATSRDQRSPDRVPSLPAEC